MTVWELNRRAEGHNRRKQHEWQMTASIMAAIVQPHSKKRVRPKDFIPSAYATIGSKMSPERIEQDIKRKLQAYRKAHAERTEHS